MGIRDIAFGGVTMVTVVRYGDDDGRNEPVYTKVYSGESEDPRSLTLETTAAFVLHSRARHLLVHGRLCLPAARLLFSYTPLFPFIFAFLCTRSPPFHSESRRTPLAVPSSVVLHLSPFYRPVSFRASIPRFFSLIVSLARYSCSFFHRYRARI